MKLLIKILEFFSSKAVAKMAYKFMSNPRIRKLREAEEKVLNEASLSKVDYHGFSLQAYEWGEKGNKVALLVHGWEGQAGNFAALIELLLDKNYHIIAFDAPSHGRSTVGPTSMFVFSDFLSTQFIKYKPSLVISHSFGSVQTASVLRDKPNLKIDLWILVTTPYSFMSRVNDMSKEFGINEKTKTELIKLIQHDTKENIKELNMANYCKGLVNIEKAIIVHSKTDKVLPIEGARKVNQSFDKSSLLELEGLGHYRILWSNELKQIVSENA